MTTLDKDRLTVLEDVAMCAAVANVFQHLAPDPASPTNYITWTENDRVWSVPSRRALLALIAADELGMSLIDALNRVRFTDGQLTFAPATTTTFDNAVRATVEASQKDSQKASKHVNAMVVPTGFPRQGEPFSALNAGELAYFIEEAKAKGGLEAPIATAYACLAERIPNADALELGKLQRWLANPNHRQRRTFFADVLTTVEGRLQEIGGTP